MKIAIVVPGISSSEQDWCIPWLLDFVRGMSRHVEVQVFALRWPEHGQLYRVFDATVHAMNGRKRLGWRVIDLWRRTLRSIAAEHRRRPFDAIHAFWADEPAWLAVVAGRRLGVPVVVTLLGGELMRRPDIEYGLQRLRLRGALVRQALKLANRVTAGSSYMAAIAKGHMPPARWTRLVIAPIGVDPTRFAPAPHATRPNGPVVLNVGSLWPVKNQAALITALADLPDGELWIAGDGPLRSDLARLAERRNVSRRVRFLGHVAHDRLAAVYRSASLLVQASHHEGQGMAVLEAAACGVPVAGTPVGILPELSVAVGDERELGPLMAALLTQETRRRDLGQALAERVRHEFTLDRTMARFLELYRGERRA